MALTASDLILYGSTGRPTSDTGGVGGGIDVAARPLSNQLSSAQAISILSDSSLDTRTGAVTYRSTDGQTYAWAFTLAGTSAVGLSTGTPEYLMSVALSSASTGRSVTVRDAAAAALHVLNPGETDAFTLFRGAYSKSTEEIRYEKLFLKNISTEADLRSATIQLTSDASTQYRIGLAATKDSTDGWADRLTDPGYTWVDSTAIAVPGSTLGFGEAIGIGVEQTLAAGATAGHPKFLIRAAGDALMST